MDCVCPKFVEYSSHRRVCNVSVATTFQTNLSARSMVTAKKINAKKKNVRTVAILHVIKFLPRNTCGFATPHTNSEPLVYGASVDFTLRSSRVRHVFTADWCLPQPDRTFPRTLACSAVCLVLHDGTIQRGISACILSTS